MGVQAPSRLLGVCSFIYQCTNDFPSTSRVLGAAQEAVDRAASRNEVFLFRWEGQTGQVI